MDTHVNRRKDRSQYQVIDQGDIQLLVSRHLVRHTRHLQVDVKKSLIVFRSLRGDAELCNGVIIGRGLPRVSN